MFPLEKRKRMLLIPVGSLGRSSNILSCFHRFLFLLRLFVGILSVFFLNACWLRQEKGRQLAQQYTKFVQSLMAYWGLRFAAKVVSVRVRCLAIILRMPQRLFFLSYRILAPFSFSLLFNANCLSVSSILCNFALA